MERGNFFFHEPGAPLFPLRFYNELYMSVTSKIINIILIHNALHTHGIKRY